MTEPSTAAESERPAGVNPCESGRSNQPLSPSGGIRDFRDLARRISNWATNLLAIGILAVAALALTSRLTEWWRSDPAELAVPFPDLPPTPWDDAAGMVLEFGDEPWSIRRQSLSGNVDDASHALVQQCRGILDESAVSTSLPAADASEQALLGRLRDAAPIEEVPNRWRLYSIGGPLPWIVGTTATTDNANDDGHGAASYDAGPAARLLCWGLALPQAEQGWTLYVLDRRPTGRRGDRVPEVPLPRGARRSLRVSSADGGALTTFSGTGPATQWMADFDEALNAGGWRRLGDRSRGDSAHSAAYEREQVPDSIRLEITLTQGPDGRWLGVAETHRRPARPTTESDAP